MLMARLIAMSGSNRQDTTPNRVAAPYDATIHAERDQVEGRGLLDFGECAEHSASRRVDATSLRLRAATDPRVIPSARLTAG